MKMKIDVQNPMLSPEGMNHLLANVSFSAIGEYALRGSGRSTAIAMSLISQALLRPYTVVEAQDHAGTGRGVNERLQGLCCGIASRLELHYLKFRLVQKGSNRYVVTAEYSDDGCIRHDTPHSYPQACAPACPPPMPNCGAPKAPWEI